ncbi:MAG: hypothetical protein WEB04_03200 [Dehalococcoidia bacterium]
MQRFTIAALLLASLTIAACGGSGGDGNGTPEAEGSIRPLPGNTELVVGQNRFAFGLVDATNHPIQQTAGTSVHIAFLLDEEPQHEQDADFIWAIPDVTGFWTAMVDFTEAGTWAARVTATQDGKESEVDFSFPVTPDGIAPTIGDPAPAAENLTLDTASITRMSTDEHPEPALYEMTITQALDADKPFVVIFATPAFCQTRFCGPVLDNIKAVLPDFSDNVNFIHIEPFELTEEGEIVADDQGAFVPAAPTNLWKLQTEPWVFIVDGNGEIAMRFEGAASVEELRLAIGAVATS